MTGTCGKFCIIARQIEQDYGSFCAERNPENNVRGTVLCNGPYISDISIVVLTLKCSQYLCIKYCAWIASTVRDRPYITNLSAIF